MGTQISSFPEGSDLGQIWSLLDNLGSGGPLRLKMGTQISHPRERKSQRTSNKRSQNRSPKRDSKTTQLRLTVSISPKIRCLPGNRHSVNVPISMRRSRIIKLGSNLGVKNEIYLIREIFPRREILIYDSPPGKGGIWSKKVQKGPKRVQKGSKRVKIGVSKKGQRSEGPQLKYKKQTIYWVWAVRQKCPFRVPICPKSA